MQTTVTAPAPLTAAAPTAGAAPDLATRSREAVRTVNGQLGPAGESGALRLERARNVDELRAALSAAVQMLAAARGRQAAQDFAARFSDICPPKRG